MINLLRCYAKVREPIELSFGVVSEISSSIGVLEGGPRAQRGRRFWGFPIGLNGVYERIKLKQKCI